MSSCCCVLDHTRRGPDPNRGSERDVPAGRRGGQGPSGQPQHHRRRRYACKSEHGPERPLARPRCLRPRAAGVGPALAAAPVRAGRDLQPLPEPDRRGLRRPSAEILQQIAKALRISAETLYVQAGILEPPSGRPRPRPGRGGPRRSARSRSRPSSASTCPSGATTRTSGARRLRAHRSRGPPRPPPSQSPMPMPESQRRRRSPAARRGVSISLRPACFEAPATRAARRAGVAGHRSTMSAMRRLAVLSLHTSPLAQPGTGDGGGMNVYVRELTSPWPASGVTCDVFARAWSADLPAVVDVEPGLRVHHVPAGPLEALPKESLAAVVDELAGGGARAHGRRAGVRRRSGRRPALHLRCTPTTGCRASGAT